MGLLDPQVTPFPSPGPGVVLGWLDALRPSCLLVSGAGVDLGQQNRRPPRSTAQGWTQEAPVGEGQETQG